MATNICSRKHPKYSTVKELAEELGCCVQQVYKTLKRPEMEKCKKKIGTAGVRVDKEEFYRLMEQIYRWKEMKANEKSIRDNVSNRNVDKHSNSNVN